MDVVVLRGSTDVLASASSCGGHSVVTGSKWLDVCLDVRWDARYFEGVDIGSRRGAGYRLFFRRCGNCGWPLFIALAVSGNLPCKSIEPVYLVCLLCICKDKKRITEEILCVTFPDGAWQ